MAATDLSADGAFCVAGSLNEELEPTARHPALDERHIAGEITFERYPRIALG